MVLPKGTMVDSEVMENETEGVTTRAYSVAPFKEGAPLRQRRSNRTKVTTDKLDQLRYDYIPHQPYSRTPSMRLLLLFPESGGPPNWKGLKDPGRPRAPLPAVSRYQTQTVLEGWNRKVSGAMAASHHT